MFTSTLTPLVGLGMITVERLYPLTLGSNIGTTITGILASLSGPPETFQSSLQIALCHTLFNVSGILIWFPVPFMRKAPVALARLLGNTTADYRWFAIAYTLIMFFVFPIIVFILSMLGTTVFIIVTIVYASIIAFVIVVNFLQHKKPSCLPQMLKTWHFLPFPLRSLDPYDKFIHKYFCFLKVCRKYDVNVDNNEESKAQKSIVFFLDQQNKKSVINEDLKISNPITFDNKAFSSDSF